MRGQSLHNQTLAAALRRAFQKRGATTAFETAVHIGERCLFADLVAERDAKRVLVEVELTPKRIESDLMKGMALACTELWIVVPEVRVAKAVRRKLRRLGVRPDRGGVWVLTLGPALKRVTRCFPLISGPNPDGKTKNMSR